MPVLITKALERERERGWVAVCKTLTAHNFYYPTPTPTLPIIMGLILAHV